MSDGVDNYPVLPAFTYTDGSTKAWCPFCKDWHHHSKDESQRVLFCENPSSPLHKTGYVLMDCIEIDGWPDHSIIHVDE
jgi:hypothetical protein